MTDQKYTLAPTEPPPSYDESAKPGDVPAESPAKPAGTPAKLPLRAPPPLDMPALNVLRGKRVILASASPRRRMLLAQVGLQNLEIIPSTAPEDFPKSLTPFEYVLKTANQKAMTVYEQEIDNTELGEPALVIAADTIVVGHFGQILEKPRSEKEHIAMLTALRDGRDHRVYTAVAVMAPLESARDPGYAMETAVEETLVRFDKDVTDEMILAYVKTREGADKAGGYGIQGIGSILIEKIEGTFDNVVGLPLRMTLSLIEKVMMPDEDLIGGLAGVEEEEDVV